MMERKRSTRCLTNAAAVWQKEEGHKIGQADFVRPAKTMSQIGG